MNVKDSQFYNQESLKYSFKRYPEKASTYVQYFFKRRLELLLRELRGLYANKRELSLLEVGCADGIVMRAVEKALPGSFSSLIGIDTAPDMVKAAQALSISKKAAFYERGHEPRGTYDIVMEVGVANYADFDEELIHAKDALKEGGRFFLSIAGKDSLNARFGQGVGYKNFYSYAQYEEKIRTHFVIEKSIPVGLYVPLIWRIPTLARVIQPMKEILPRMILPNLFHEKLYVLSAK